MAEAPCERARAALAEFVLGVLAGDERAALLGHIGACAACRAEAAYLSEVADGLLLLAPEVEPPVGFEAGVVGAWRGPRRRRLGVNLAAAAAIAALLTGSALWIATAPERDLARSYRRMLAAVDGRYFTAAPLEGEVDGAAYGYSGEPSWVFVVVRSGPPGSYRCSALTESGATVVLGSFELGGAPGHWGTVLPFDVDELGALRLELPNGGSVEASF